jgi:hypothetical protein
MAIFKSVCNCENTYFKIVFILCWWCRIGFFPDFPCTTDGDSKQENQFSTIGISDTQHKVASNLGFKKFLLREERENLKGPIQ